MDGKDVTFNDEQNQAIKLARSVSKGKPTSSEETEAKTVVKKSVLLRRTSVSVPPTSKSGIEGNIASTSPTNIKTEDNGFRVANSTSIAADRGVGLIMAEVPAMTKASSSFMKTPSSMKELPSILAHGIDLRQSKSLESPKINLDKVKFGPSLSTTFPDFGSAAATANTRNNLKSIGGTRVLGKNVRIATVAASKSHDNLNDQRFASDLDDVISSPLKPESFGRLIMQITILAMISFITILTVAFIPLPETDGPGADSNWILIFFYIPLIHVVLALTIGYFSPKKVIGTLELNFEGAFIMSWALGEVIAMVIYGVGGYPPLNGIAFLGSPVLLSIVLPIIFQIASIRSTPEFKFLYFKCWRNIIILSIVSFSAAVAFLILNEHVLDETHRTLFYLGYHAFAASLKTLISRIIFQNTSSSANDIVQDPFYVRSVFFGAFLEQICYYMVAISFLELKWESFSMGLLLQFLEAMAFPISMQLKGQIKHAATMSMVSAAATKAQKTAIDSNEDKKNDQNGFQDLRIASNTIKPIPALAINGPAFLSLAVTHLISHGTRILVCLLTITLAVITRSGPNAGFLPFWYQEDKQFDDFISKCLLTAVIIFIALIYTVWIIKRDRKVNLLNIIPLIISRHFTWFSLIFAAGPVCVTLILVKHTNILWHFINVAQIAED